MTLVIHDNPAPTAPARAARLTGRMRELVMHASAPESAARNGASLSVYDLIAYHLGWLDDRGRAINAPSGKLLRPSACLVTASAFGAPPAALDAACAIEFVHAFSLVHDDIEDGDEERRHRPTLWVVSGVPLAINAGDSLLALAHRTMTDATGGLQPQQATAALRLFADALLLMIEGQHDDIAFESCSSVTLAAHEAMAAKKTGALMGAALAIGAVFGYASATDVEALRGAGVALGLAFQAVDDTLAIWGDPRATGKPAKNDLARGKKSLPVVLAHALGLPPEDTMVRDRCLARATHHAATARRLVRSTGMAPEARAELDAMIDFVLERES